MRIIGEKVPIGRGNAANRALLRALAHFLRGLSLLPCQHPLQLFSTQANYFLSVGTYLYLITRCYTSSNAVVLYCCFTI